MSKRFTSAHASLLIAAAIVAACGGDQALVAPRLGDGAPPLGVVTTPAGAPVLPVRRAVPLAQDRSWSFDVGPDGVVSQDSRTGLTIEVPAGAVSAPTHITVIALKGAALAYRFEPHGLQFPVPIRLVQSLRSLAVKHDLLGIPPLSGGMPNRSCLTARLRSDCTSRIGTGNCRPCGSKRYASAAPLRAMTVMCVGADTAPAGTSIVSPVRLSWLTTPSGPTSKLQLRSCASGTARRTGRTGAPAGVVTTPNGGAPSPSRGATSA